MSLASLQRSFTTARQQSDTMILRAMPNAGMLASGGNSMLGAVNQAILAQGAKRLDPERYNTGWFYAATRITAMRIAGQEFVVARKRRNRRKSYDKSLEAITPKNYHGQLGNLDVLESHPLLDAINKPNQIMTKWALFFVTVGSLELTAVSYYWVRDDDGDGRKDIWPIPSHWMRPVYGTDDAHLGWEMTPENSTESFFIPASQIVRITYPNPCSPVRLQSPLQAAGKPVEIDESILDCQRKSFRSPHPSIALTVGRLPGTNGINGPRAELSPDQRSRIDGLFRQMYSGSLNYDKPIILDGMLEKFDFLSRGVKEMDYNNNAKNIKERIMQICAVNPISAGQCEGANRASALVADQNLLSVNVLPKIELLSEAFTRWLCPMFAEPGEELVCWIKPAISIDRELDLQEANSMMDRGALRMDEYRHRFGHPPVGGKYGRAFLVPVKNYSLVDDNGIPLSKNVDANQTEVTEAVAAAKIDAAAEPDTGNAEEELAEEVSKFTITDESRVAIISRLAIDWTVKLAIQRDKGGIHETLHKAALAAATAELWTTKGEYRVSGQIATMTQTWAKNRNGYSLRPHESLPDEVCAEEIKAAMDFGRSLIKEDVACG